MENEISSFCCPITQKIFFDPVFLACNKKHVFEKESLLNRMEEYNQCPLCNHPVEDDNEIQMAVEIKNAINEAINKQEINAYDQYLPRYVLFNLLIGSSDTMPLSRIEKLLEYHAGSQIPLMTKDNLVSKKDYLIAFSLKIWPDLMVYFLWQSIQISKLQIVVEKLIKLKCFNEITINQLISKKNGDELHHHSISYLLLDSVDGRKILSDNILLRELIGETLSKNILNQFLHENTHKGTLYYLLISEVGNKILSEYSNLRDKIDPIALSKQIVDGPEKGVSFGDLYKRIFPDPPEKKFST